MINRLPLSSRAQIAYAHDLTMTALSFVVALYLRVGDGITGYVDLLLKGSFALVGAAAVV